MYRELDYNFIKSNITSEIKIKTLSIGAFPHVNAPINTIDIEGPRTGLEGLSKISLASKMAAKLSLQSNLEFTDLLSRKKFKMYLYLVKFEMYLYPVNI